jgi:hypothetical protein
LCFIDCIVISVHIVRGRAPGVHKFPETVFVGCAQCEVTGGNGVSTLDAGPMRNVRLIGEGARVRIKQRGLSKFRIISEINLCSSNFRRRRWQATTMSVRCHKRTFRPFQQLTLNRQSSPEN